MRWSPSNHRLRHPSRQHLRTTPKARCVQMPRRSLRPVHDLNSPGQEPKRRRLRQRLQRRKTPSQPLQQHRLTPRKKTARPRSPAQPSTAGDTKCGKTPHATRPRPFGGAHKASSALISRRVGSRTRLRITPFLRQRFETSKAAATSSKAEDSESTAAAASLDAAKEDCSPAQPPSPESEKTSTAAIQSAARRLMRPDRAPSAAPTKRVPQRSEDCLSDWALPEGRAATWRGSSAAPTKRVPQRSEDCSSDWASAKNPFSLSD